MTDATVSGFACFGTFEDRIKACRAVTELFERAPESYSLLITPSADFTGFDIQGEGNAGSLEWQLTQILDLCKPLGLTEFDGDVWVRSECGVYFNADD